MNLPRLQSIIAPLSAPAAPAVLLANEIYRTMLVVDIAPIIAMISAIIAIVGVEFSGALMCHNAVKAWQRRSLGIMAVAIGGALVYAAIVIAAIASMPEERGQIFGVMVLLTLVAYAGYAIYTAFEDDDASARQAAMAELDLLDKRRLLINAETRQIKAGAGTVQRSIEQTPVQNEQIEHTKPVMVTAKGQAIIDYLNANGDGASLREIAKACGVSSPASVSKWLEYWRQNADQ